jgi:plasmid stability protein
MASITIRNLDDDVKRRLRVRAAEHGRSMEEEARDILRQVVGPARRRTSVRPSMPGSRRWAALTWPRRSAARCGLLRTSSDQ